MTTAPLLKVTDLNVHYGRGPRRNHVLVNTSIVVPHGQAVGLVGETGSGKTTLARAILGLVAPSSGTIELDGVPIQDLSRRELRRLRHGGDISYVFQDPLRSLDPDRTIVDSVYEPLEIRGGFKRSDLRERVKQLLASVDLGEWVLDLYPHEISGGQRQRVAIARALITNPKLLILDEPVSALDAPNRARVLEILRSLRSTGVAMIFISHDLGSVAGLTDRTVVLYRGEIKEQGPTERLINNPEHPYTQLLIGSAPRMFGQPLSAEQRGLLRQKITKNVSSKSYSS